MRGLTRLVTSVTIIATDHEARAGQDAHLPRADRSRGYRPPILETEMTCSVCGNVAWAKGAGRASQTVACILLRLSCPMGERNFYVPL